MAGIFQGIKSFFWGNKDDSPQQQQQQQQQQQAGWGSGTHRGFQAKRHRSGPSPLAPVLQDAVHSGGVQGLDWYARSLQADADGELAHEVLHEGADGTVSPAPSRAARGCRVVDVCSGSVITNHQRRQQLEQEQKERQQQQQQEGIGKDGKAQELQQQQQHTK